MPKDTAGHVAAPALAQVWALTHRAWRWRPQRRSWGRFLGWGGDLAHKWSAREPSPGCEWGTGWRGRGHAGAATWPAGPRSPRRRGPSGARQGAAGMGTGELPFSTSPSVLLFLFQLSHLLSIFKSLFLSGSQARVKSLREPPASQGVRAPSPSRRGRRCWPLGTSSAGEPQGCQPWRKWHCPHQVCGPAGMRREGREGGGEEEARGHPLGPRT